MASRKASIVTTGKTQDDTGILDSEMLKFASVRVPLAVTAALLPVLLSSMLYISTFSITTQLFVGAFMGLIAMFSFQLFQVHRSTVRRHKALQISQLSELSRDDVSTLITEMSSFPLWAPFTEFDKVEWLNKQMDILWPYIDKAGCEIVKEQLQPLLAPYTMGPIHKFTLKDLTLGNKAPRFDGIKVSEGEDDETVLETKFEWNPQGENIVMKIESTGPDFKVQVKHIHVSGTLKFILKPLMDVVPCFGALLVSFTEAPDVDFDLKFDGGSIDALPGVEKLIDNSIRTALMDSMVWPCRIVVPVAPGDWSYLDLHPVAELDITLIEAQDIMKTDIIGKSDPFCMFYVRMNAEKIKRSTTKNNKKNAVWNEGFIVEVEDKETQSLTVRLMDEESLEKAQYIGSAEYKVADMKPGISEDLWLDMVENPSSSSKEASRGRVHILLIYKPLPDSDPRRKAAIRGAPDGPEETPNEETPDDMATSPHLGDKPHL